MECSVEIVELKILQCACIYFETFFNRIPVGVYVNSEAHKVINIEKMLINMTLFINKANKTFVYELCP